MCHLQTRAQTFAILNLGAILCFIVHIFPSTPSTKIISYYIDKKTLRYVEKKTSAYNPTNGSKFV
jgi:hypothetical protein